MKQINCKDFKGMVVDALYNYDQLSGEDKHLFHAHLTTCPDCAGEYEEMVGVLALMDQRDKPEMEEGFWDSYYLRLMEKMKESEEREKNKVKNKIWSWLKKWWENFKFDIPRLRWVLLPAAAVLLIVIGIVIGRYLYLPPVPGRIGVESNVSPIVAEHFESLRPLLIDCANYDAQEAGSGEDFVLIDKKTLKKLVLQNLLLKRIAARGNDVVLTQVLEELELVLLELSNAEPGESNGDIAGKETIGRVREILKKNDTLFKMKIYNKSEVNRNVQLKI